MADRFSEQAESDLTYLVDKKNGDRVIKQLLLNSVIAKYHDLIIIIYLLTTDKSWYFPCSIIINNNYYC